jgi:release factor glutamine methyltransferase
MYKPEEDSFLLLKHIKDYASGNVLEIGTGSGILAQEAAKYSGVLAVDIDKKLIKRSQKENKNPNINFIFSDLFSNINEKFNLIIFNPPYLPSEKIKYKEIDGGVRGTEIIERFLKEAKNHLSENGKILLLVSSLNKGIEQLFMKYEYKFNKIDEQKMFFEKLFIYELSS